MDAALAAVIGSSLVGIAGVGFGWLNSRGERSNAVILARDQHEQERRQARGDRLFDARASAYEELLRRLRWVTGVVDRTHPVWVSGPELAKPDPPTPEQWESMYAKFAVYGSDELMEAFDAFADTVRAFNLAADTYGRLRNSAELGDSGQKMEQRRGEVREALKVIERRMRKELADL